MGSIVNCYAIQTWYKLQTKDEGRGVRCDEVIKIPLDLSIINGGTRMTPCVVITTGNPRMDQAIKIEIETNEGIIIEPIKVACQAILDYVYILTLPPKTTGVKNVKVLAVANGRPIKLQNNLTFDIMQPPYDYTGAILNNVSRWVEKNSQSISDINIQMYDLTARVVALEQKP